MALRKIYQEKSPQQSAQKLEDYEMALNRACLQPVLEQYLAKTVTTRNFDVKRGQDGETFKTEADGFAYRLKMALSSNKQGSWVPEKQLIRSFNDLIANFPAALAVDRYPFDFAEALKERSKDLTSGNPRERSLISALLSFSGLADETVHAITLPRVLTANAQEAADRKVIVDPAARLKKARDNGIFKRDEQVSRVADLWWEAKSSGKPTESFVQETRNACPVKGIEVTGAAKGDRNGYLQLIFEPQSVTLKDSVTPTNSEKAPEYNFELEVRYHTNTNDENHTLPNYRVALRRSDEGRSRNLTDDSQYFELTNLDSKRLNEIKKMRSFSWLDFWTDSFGNNWIKFQGAEGRPISPYNSGNIDWKDPVYKEIMKSIHI